MAALFYLLSVGMFIGAFFALPASALYCGAMVGAGICMAGFGALLSSIASVREAIERADSNQWAISRAIWHELRYPGGDTAAPLRAGEDAFDAALAAGAKDKTEKS